MGVGAAVVPEAMVVEGLAGLELDGGGLEEPVEALPYKGGPGMVYVVYFL